MSTKVILNHDIPNLGEEGDVITVANGYARNFLIPKKMVVPFNKATIALFESRKAAIERRKEEKRDEAKSMKERLESLDLVIPMTAGESGRLFGSVSNANIVEELAKKGIVIERKRIDVQAHSIKMVGRYPVSVKLYGDEVAEMKIEVVASGAPVKTKAPEAVVKPEPVAEPEDSEDDELDQ